MDLKSLLHIVFCKSLEQIARDSFKICSKRKMLASGSGLTNMRTGASEFGRMCRICHEATSGIPYVCPGPLLTFIIIALDLLEVDVLILHEFEKCVNN